MGGGGSGEEEEGLRGLGAGGVRCWWEGGRFCVSFSPAEVRFKKRTKQKQNKKLADNHVASTRPA